MSQHKPCIDQILRYDDRTFRTLPGKLLLGSTGKRLCADYLDPVAGFQGRIDFIHKTNIPLIFSVVPEQLDSCTQTTESVWYPSHLHLQIRENNLFLQEDKFISYSDVLVSIQQWTNHSEQDIALRLELPLGYRTSPDGSFRCNFEIQNHHLPLQLAVKTSARTTQQSFVLPAHGHCTLVIAATLWIDDIEDGRTNMCEIERLLSAGTDALKQQVAEYDQWFNTVPTFSSNDELLNKTWWYRWFLLRHNYAEPHTGLMQHGVFYEGRSHKVDKTPFASKGHEFSQLIPLSTPMHLCDCRWKRNDYECRESLLSLVDSMDEHGFFSTTMIDKHGASYGHYAQWAFFQTMLIHPDLSLIHRLLPAYKFNFLQTLKAQVTAADILPVCYDHRRTGKEYQPSFWYFNNFPDYVKDNTSFTPLKRVDLAAYMFRNACGLASLCRMAGDADASQFDKIADQLRHLTLNKMWDSNDGFFYDLHYQTEEKAKVKNIVGIDPLWAGIANQEPYLQALTILLSDEFATGDCFASTGKSGPIFMPQGGWRGNFFKGRNGCMWNGSSWPFTTSIALDAIAQTSKRHQHRYDKAFGTFLRQYSLEHYKEHNLKKPYLVEHYDCITGEALSDEVDYLHSYYIDLIIRHVCGLEPTSEGLIIDPIDIGLTYFELDNLLISGHEVRIMYHRSTGCTVTIDNLVRVKNHTHGECFIPF